MTLKRILPDLVAIVLFALLSFVYFFPADTEGRVLSESGEAIPGLYAAGEITGGIHGANRLGGNAVVDTVVFGKLAGETVVKDAQ